jgi:hypothetical protein
MADTFCVHHRKTDEFCIRCFEAKQAKAVAKAKPPVKSKPAEPPLPLTADERTTLNGLEDVVQRGIGTFMEVGTALQQIRESRLYRDEFATFAEYIETRWQMSKRHADRLIEAAEVSATMAEMGPMGPTSERQARALAPLKNDPPAMAEAYVEASADGKATGRTIQKAVAKRVIPKPSATKPTKPRPPVRVCLIRDDVVEFSKMLTEQATDPERLARVLQLLANTPA